ncbi:MAG: hypothetical protein PHR73_01350 [Candidatus Omnitrophica bacterium]|nr:hypothetical protein [Candidatus Omnitrophota bacterium]
MIKKIAYLILTLIVLSSGAAVPFIYANEARIDKEALKTDKAAEEEDKKELEDYIGGLRMIYEKMAKRTGEYWDLLDGLLFTVNDYSHKVQEAGQAKAYKEFIAVASDYNSVLGDLGVMQAILDMSKLAEGEKFIEYYVLMENGFEKLKGSFSLKNEVFLERIAKLKNADALRYEKNLLRHYKEYFEYDLHLDKINEAKDGLKDGE